ncbi:hypothetical protein LDENG_00263500, partial [Lucifuga dentata]
FFFCGDERSARSRYSGDDKQSAPITALTVCSCRLKDQTCDFVCCSTLNTACIDATLLPTIFQKCTTGAVNFIIVFPTLQTATGFSSFQSQINLWTLETTIQPFCMIEPNIFNTFHTCNVTDNHFPKHTTGTVN